MSESAEQQNADPAAKEASQPEPGVGLSMFNAEARAAIMAELESCEERALELRDTAAKHNGEQMKTRLEAEADFFDIRADEIVSGLGIERAMSSRDWQEYEGEAL